MDDKEKERLSLVLYDVVCEIKNTLSLPVHDTLYKSFLYSLLMFAICAISKLMKLFTFLSWQGTLSCTLVLGILLWIERAQNNAYERTLKAAKAKFKQAQIKAQKLNTVLGGEQRAVSGVSHDDQVSSEQIGGRDA